MRFIIILLMLVASTTGNAQSIRTTVTEKFDVKRMYDVVHTFAFGDTVSIHAYKKKGDKYYFLVEAFDYADIINCRNIPFDATEKQLKKLPNALKEDAAFLLKQKKEDVERRLKDKCKQRALAGEFWTTVASNYALTPVSGTDTKLKQGDVVYVVGYTSGSMEHKYALYSTTFAGVFKATSTYRVFEKEIDTKYLPAVDDNDVQQFLAEKQREIIQRQAEAKVQYRGRVLKGEIKGILSRGTLESVANGNKPFNSGDTVSIIGYSNSGGTYYYALYSDVNAGTFKTKTNTEYLFKNTEDIDFEKLPAYDDPEVKLVIEQQSAVVYSVMQVRLAESQKRLEEVTTSLIQSYKDNQPFVITDIYWDSNSVGGIEVSLKITNCTQQTIKYVTFQGYFKNAVGDKCRNEIGGGTVWKAKGIGPIGPCPSTMENCHERMYDCEGSYNFDNLTFYSRVANTFKLSTVTVQYMNGRTITLSGANLDKHVRY